MPQPWRPARTHLNWRKPRVGLTKHERGFPLKWLDSRLTDAGFEIVRRSLCVFPATPRLGNMFGVSAYSKRGFVLLDQFMSIAMSWNYRYHRDTVFKKLAPSSVFYIVRKT